MRQNRLFELLRTLAPQEVVRLRQFVDSPYFRTGEQREQLLPLLDLCLEVSRSSDNVALDKDALHAALSLNKPVVSRKIEKSLNVLHQMAVRFLIVDQYLSPAHEPEQQLLLAKTFQDRGLIKRSKSVLNAVQKQLEQYEHQEWLYYFWKLRLSIQMTDVHTLSFSEQRAAMLNQSFEELYLLYHAIRLELSANATTSSNRSLVNLSDLALQLLHEVPNAPELIEANPFLLLCHLHLSLDYKSTPDLALYQKAIAVLRRKTHLLNQESAQNAWALARNIAAGWWNIHKDKNYGSVFLEVSLESLNRGYLYYHGSISPYALEGICKIANELDQPDLALRILNEHRGKIVGESEDEPFYRYYLARHYLFTGNIQEGLRILPASMPENSFQLNARIVEIQLLYEERSELLPYRMDALRLKLNRTVPDWCSPARIRNVRAFLNALARIQRCPPGNIRRLEAIQAQIRAAPNTAEYYWLLAKVGASA
jgi:hypothetical protein